MSDNFSVRARARAGIATLGFAIWGAGMLFLVLDWGRSLPLVFFYALMLLNTYFSIRTFATITPPHHRGQQALDLLLGLCLALLPINFNFTLNFILLATALFIFATLKYIFLVPLTGWSRLLYMKIRVDTLGTLMCFGALLLALWGHPRLAALGLAAVFCAANCYVLYWERHYALHLHNTPFP